MTETKKITATVPQELLDQALELTGEGISETVRQGLQLIAGSDSEPQLRALVAKTTLTGLPAKPVGEMSDSEELASLRIFMKAKQALDDAVAFVAGREAISTDTEELKRLRIERAELEADLAKVNARLNAFQAGMVKMVPPSPQTVSSIGKLAEQVGELALAAQQADQVVAAAKAVFEIWTGTQA